MEPGLVDLTKPPFGNNNNMINKVINGRNKAITVASITCSTQIPRVVMMATRAAVMAVDSGTPVATVAKLNPCALCGDEILVGEDINRRMEPLKDSSDSSSDGQTGGVGEE